MDNRHGNCDWKKMNDEYRSKAYNMHAKLLLWPIISSNNTHGITRLIIAYISAMLNIGLLSFDLRTQKAQKSLQFNVIMWKDVFNTNVSSL